MLNVLSVFIGGGLGAVLRYLTGIYFLKNLHLNFPFSTLTVNIFGCFLLGFLYIIFVNKTDMSTVAKLSLTVGFCGGLTTFSTFSVEIIEMLRSANYLNAMLYVILSLFLGLAAIMIGAYFAKLCL